MRPLGSTRILLIGAGGIGAPAAFTLAAAGVPAFTVVDDDRVELSNLHRQILFRDHDVGRPKLEAFAEALERRFPKVRVTTSAGRALPDTVEALVRSADVVIDATDNFATRFLLADACHLAKKSVVHAAAVRFHATVMAVGPTGRPCYRCLFEDIPEGDAPDCATAGVVGPVCGVAGALAADRTLGILAGDESALGHIVTYDGLRDVLRQTAVSRRPGCALCGETPGIFDIDSTRYEQPMCGL